MASGQRRLAAFEFRVGNSEGRGRATDNVVKTVMTTFVTHRRRLRLQPAIYGRKEVISVGPYPR